MHSVNVEIEVDLPDGVTVRGYERHQGAHVFEIDFELPERCVCPKCRREADANVRWKNEVLPVRDLDLFGQPTFWVYQPPMHQCPYCRQRTQLATPFKRPRATYTYRFEEWVLELLTGRRQHARSVRFDDLGMGSGETAGRHHGDRVLPSATARPAMAL